MPKLLYTGPSPHSGHRIDKFIRCPQRWAYDQITPSPLPGRTESPALIKGTLGHIGLAHYYRRLQADQQGEDKSQWWAPIRAIEERAAQEGPSWLQHVTEAQGAVEAYILLTTRLAVDFSSQLPDDVEQGLCCFLRIFCQFRCHA